MLSKYSSHTQELLFPGQAPALVQLEVLPREKTQVLLHFTSSKGRAAQPPPSCPGGERRRAQVSANSVLGCVRRESPAPSWGQMAPGAAPWPLLSTMRKHRAMAGRTQQGAEALWYEGNGVSGDSLSLRER